MHGHVCPGERSPILISERLILRHWRESDREPFARVNADLRVMEYMPHALSNDDSDALADRSRHIFDSISLACAPWNFHKMAAFPAGWK
jgi:RimJ/RimL family protein N-acetyltransferase